MQIRVLGSVDLCDGGTVIPVRGARLTRTLAALAARVDRTVTTDELAEVIWPGGPPESAKGAIHVAVSAARRLLVDPDGPSIVTEVGGYRLVAQPGQLDALAFEELLAEARTAAREGRAPKRARCLVDALQLWRGQPFGGLDDAGMVSAECRRLDERRLVAEEDLLATLLQVGRPQEVLERVDAVIAAEPYRERLIGVKMLALYRSGRQSDALATYAQFRMRLRDDLGLRPGDELRQLERLVLLQDPTLDASEPTEGQAAAHDVHPVHVHVVWPDDDRRGVAWADVVTSLGGDATAESAATFHDVPAALDAARAFAAAGGGIGLAASSDRAEALALAAPPGRILLDSETVQQVRRDGADGVIIDHGEHRLADLAPPSPVGEWTDGNLASAQSPLRSCSIVPTRLGTDPTPFVGRRELRREVAEHLTTGRVVCLVGPPGSGKTRLARRVAAERAWLYPGGAWFVELEATASGDDIACSLAAMVGVILRAGTDPTHEIGAHLGRHATLVVLDGAEHMIGEVTQFIDAISKSDRPPTLLVTTRQRLRAPGEHVVHVGPLADDVGLDDARTILRSRLAAHGGIAIDPQDEATLIREVDGVPLALELLAAQVAALGSATVLRRLNELLTGDGLTRSFRSSEQSLTPVDRAVLRRVSVFVGPFTVEAAEQVVGDPTPCEPRETGGEGDNVDERTEPYAVPVDAVASSISRLVDASLLVPANVGGSVRHRMLTVVRAVAGQRLADAGEELWLRDRHARWAAHAGWQHAGALVGRHADSARSEIETLLPDLRAALAHLDASDHRDRHLFAVAGLWFYWYFSGRLTEGRAVTQAALRRPGGRPNHRAIALGAAANLAWWQCDYDNARRCLAQARELTGVETETGYFDIVDGSLAWIDGDLDRATAALGAALARARASDGFELPMAAAMAGNVAWWRGDLLGAAALYREGREASIARRNAYTEALCARHEALQLGLVGQTERSRTLSQTALTICRRLGDVIGLGQTLVYSGLVELDAEEPERAAVLVTEGVRTAARPGDIFCLVVASPGVAQLLVDSGNIASATRWLGWRDGTMARSGLTSPANDQQRVAALDRRVLEELGVEAHGRYRAKGRSLSLDELIDDLP